MENTLPLYKLPCELTVFVRAETGRPLDPQDVADRAYVRTRVKMLALQSETARRMTEENRLGAIAEGIPELWFDAAALAALRDLWLGLLRSWDAGQADTMAACIVHHDIEGLYAHDFYAEERACCELCRGENA